MSLIVSPLPFSANIRLVSPHVFGQIAQQDPPIPSSSVNDPLKQQAARRVQHGYTMGLLDCIGVVISKHSEPIHTSVLHVEPGSALKQAKHTKRELLADLKALSTHGKRRIHPYPSLCARRPKPRKRRPQVKRPHSRNTSILITGGRSIRVHETLLNALQGMDLSKLSQTEKVALAKDLSDTCRVAKFSSIVFRKLRTWLQQAGQRQNVSILWGQTWQTGSAEIHVYSNPAQNDHVVCLQPHTPEIPGDTLDAVLDNFALIRLAPRDRLFTSDFPDGLSASALKKELKRRQELRRRHRAQMIDT